jgi:predicted small lipoprotein YifL
MDVMLFGPLSRCGHATHERGYYILVLSLACGLAVAGCGRKGPLKPLKSQTPVLILPTGGVTTKDATRW